VHAQPLYGFASKDPARFLRAAGHGDPFYIQDPELSIAQARQPPRAASFAGSAAALPPAELGHADVSSRHPSPVGTRAAGCALGARQMARRARPVRACGVPGAPEDAR